MANVYFFEKLTADRNPDYLYIGCSDSRVAVKEMMGVGPGKVFVHRNMANVVNTLDMSSTAVIQYAIEYLDVKHIVVCGHYDCEEVKAVTQAKDYGLLDPWLRAIHDVYHLHQQELNAIADADERYHHFVEINVIEQYFNVTEMAAVQENHLQYHIPSVHDWVSDTRPDKSTGLNIDFEDLIQKIQRICDLTREDWYEHY